MTMTDARGKLEFRFAGEDAEKKANALFEAVPRSIGSQDLTRRNFGGKDIWFVEIDPVSGSFTSEFLRQIADLLEDHEPLVQDDF